MKAIKSIYPFKSHYWELPGRKKCRMHYLDEGQGEPVVMLHGNPTWSFFYRNLVQFLKPMYRCLVPDHIGCGLSDKPQDYPYCLQERVNTILDWLTDLKIGHFHLVVHDWGGAIGMGVATHWPASVQSLTILNSAAFLSDKIPFRIELCRLPWLGAWAVRHLNLFARAATWMASTQGLSDRIKQGYLYPYKTPQSRVAIDAFVRDIPMVPEHPSYEFLKQIQDSLWLLEQKPCLLAWGMKDFCFTPEFLSMWRNYFPGAKVCCFENAGHYILEDANEEVNLNIRQFLLKNPLTVSKL